MARRRSSGGPVRRPLTPPVLGELGALGSFPAARGGFEPEGAWTHRYRIWTCYGHRGRSNGNAGFLRVERQVAGAGGSFTLSVERAVVNAERQISRVRTDIQCRNDPLASPTAWTLASEVAAPGGGPAPALGTQESVRVAGQTLRVQVGGRRFERPVPQRFTADWCLFEAVQRLPFQAGPELAFDCLEGLSLLKRGQRLAYRGSEEATWDGQAVRLHSFQQVGRGVLPYEYWLDDHHRLLLVVTGPRAYVLDERAERVITRRSRPAARKGGR